MRTAASRVPTIRLWAGSPTTTSSSDGTRSSERTTKRSCSAGRRAASPRSFFASGPAITRFANAFDAPNPVYDLGAGDFDGDGVDDLFIGTGSGWFFSPAGKAEWRFLNRMPEHASALRFGDFDGDGRADVLALHGAELVVSWAGVSSWQTINVTAWALSDLAIGDFDGDHAADIFLATGAEWFFAPGGRNWQHFATSVYRTRSLRFGDFTRDGKTDVFSVGPTQWQIVSKIDGTWASLGPAFSSNVDELVVADFDGDGYADNLVGVFGRRKRGLCDAPRRGASAAGSGAYRTLRRRHERRRIRVERRRHALRHRAGGARPGRNVEQAGHALTQTGGP